jgi:hypothetical protein
VRSATVVDDSDPSGPAGYHIDLPGIRGDAVVDLIGDRASGLWYGELSGLIVPAGCWLAIVFRSRPHPSQAVRLLLNPGPGWAG